MKSNLFARICSALVLAPVVLIAGWLGGWPFMLLVLAVSAAVSFEWLRIIVPGATPLAVILMLGLVLASLYLFAVSSLQTAFWPVFLLFGGIVVAGYALDLKLWLGAGFAYAVLLGALSGQPIFLPILSVEFSKGQSCGQRSRPARPGQGRLAICARQSQPAPRFTA